MCATHRQLVGDGVEGDGLTGAEGLALAMAQPGMVDAILRLLGALVEFNATNKELVRCVCVVF